MKSKIVRKVYKKLKKNKFVAEQYKRFKEGKNTYSLGQICKIMGIDCPKKFKSIKNSSKFITTKQARIKEGTIFFALYNKSQTNKWYKVLIDKGAEVIFVDSEDAKRNPPAEELPVIVVDNLIEKAGKFISYIRRKYKVNTIAITGSVGKTTTTQLLNCVVSKEFNTFCNKGNLNSYNSVANHIMTCLTKDLEVYIQECGAGDINSIRKCAAMLESNAYILTNVLPHHLNNYKTIDNVFKDKTSFSDYMRKDGVVVTNYDEDNIVAHKFPHKVITFGVKTKRDVDYRAINIKQNGKMLEFDVVYSEGQCHIKINIVGEHNVYNGLAVFAMCKWLNISDEKIAEHLLDFKTTGIRQNIVNVAGITFYLDCYNVCNTSIKATIKTLEDMKVKKGNKKIALLGGENKLGPDYESITYGLGKELKDAKVDYIICYSLAKDNDQKSINYYGHSKPLYESLKDNGFKNAIYIDNEEDLTKKVKELCKPGDIVLLKGNAELDMLYSIDKTFGSSFSVDYEYNDDRTEYLETNEYRIKTNNDFKEATIEEYLGDKENLEEVIIPNEILDRPVFKLGKRLFRNNRAIKKVSLGDSVKNIGVAAFSGCSGLEKIEIPSNVKYIHNSAFGNCKNLKEIIINEGVLHIERSAFYNDFSLEKVTLPKSLQYIDDHAFNGIKKKFIIYCYKDSVAADFAKRNNIEYKYIK